MSKKIAQNLRDLREGQKLDLATVAVRSGLPKHAVEAIEKSGRMTLDQLIRLSRAYSYTPGGLVNRIVPKGR